MLDAFSFPKNEFGATLDHLVPVIAQEYASGLTAAYLGRHAGAIAATTEGLIEHLARWVAHSKGIDTTRSVKQPVLGWDYVFGDAYRSMCTSDDVHPRVAKRLQPIYLLLECQELGLQH